MLSYFLKLAFSNLPNLVTLTGANIFSDAYLKKSETDGLLFVNVKHFSSLYSAY